jgi:hypothetical protein
MCDKLKAPSPLTVQPVTGFPFKQGDKVRIVRKAVRKENGWNNVWVSEMDKAVGKEGIVMLSVLPSDKDVTVRIPGIVSAYGYPSFVLELVNAPVTQTTVVTKKIAPTVVVKKTASITKKLLAPGQRILVTGNPVWAGEAVVERIASYPDNIIVKMTTGRYTGMSGGFRVDQLTTIPTSGRKSQALQTARDLAVKLAQQNPAKTVTADWVQDELTKLGFTSTDLGNAAGVIFKGGQLRNTGATAKSARPGNNHRRIAVWEYIGNGPVTGRFIVETEFRGGTWLRSGNNTLTIPKTHLASHVFPNLESATKEAEAQQRTQNRRYRAVPLP